MGSVATEHIVGTEYKLPRGGREAVRLAAQHHALVARQGWLLHPTVAKAVRDISKPRIADIACGTGIWALELAQQMPHAEIIGLDVSDGQFCPEWTLPSNTSLGLYDLLEDVPVHLREQFDVVHVRLLLAAGPSVDKSIFIERFRSLLRPGGWLQWEEFNFPLFNQYMPTAQRGTFATLDTNNHPFALMANKLLALDDRVGWVSNFEKVMRQIGGYEAMDRHVVRMLPHLLQLETDLLLAVKTEAVETIIRNKRIEDTQFANELRGGVAALYADVERGILLSYPWNVCIAKRL